MTMGSSCSEWKVWHEVM